MLLIKDLTASRELDAKGMSAVRGGYAANQTNVPQYGSDYSSYQPTSGYEPTASYEPTTSYEPTKGYEPSGYSNPLTCGSPCNYPAPKKYY